MNTSEIEKSSGYGKTPLRKEESHSRLCSEVFS